MPRMQVGRIPVCAVVIFATALAATAPAQAAPADEPVEAAPTIHPPSSVKLGSKRRGFAFSLALAGAAGYNESVGAGGGLSLAIGGYVAPDLAVLLKVQSGVSVTLALPILGPIFSYFEGDSTTVAGPAVQYWLSKRWYLLGGAGLGYVAHGSMLWILGIPLSYGDESFGFGLQAEVGCSLLTTKHHDLGLFLGGTPVIGKTVAVMGQFGLIWQVH